MTDTIPPGRQDRIASRSACPRSDSERLACLTRSTACSAPWPCTDSIPTASMTASGPRPPVSSLSCSTMSASSTKMIVGRPRLVARHPQAVVVVVDGDHALGPAHHRAGDRELTDRPGAEHRDDLAAGDLAELRAHVARREDVREEQDLLVGQVVLDLDRA